VARPGPEQPTDATPKDLAEALGHGFRQKALLRKALTHPSAADSAFASYERLEFLGDRVLGLVVADMLFARFPNEPEGALAKRLAALVRRETLAEVAATMGLSAHLILARAEQEAGEAQNPALLADACEAVIAALYLDGGFEVARRFIEHYWTPLLEADLKPPQDPKTALQEWAQGRGLALPVYRELLREGPAHQPRFTVEVSVAGAEPARGEGLSKRLAEQAAAKLLLARLEGRPA
jgi:ribonuclease-3